MLYTRKRTYEVNPDIKILASNLSLGGITYSIYDPDLLKKVFLDHSNYEKLPIILFSDLFYDKALFGVSGAEWK
jgi:hypothetical protein